MIPPSRPMPSSARRCSSAGSNLAHSSASRVRASRASFSARADSTAWLRFSNRCRATSSSTRSSSAASSVRATLAFGMVVSPQIRRSRHGPTSGCRQRRQRPPMGAFDFPYGQERGLLANMKDQGQARRGHRLLHGHARPRSRYTAIARIRATRRVGRRSLASADADDKISRLTCGPTFDRSGRSSEPLRVLHRLL